MRLTDEGRAMVEEMNYGHNPLAYLCSKRPDDQDFVADALCIKCADGFEAIGWKRRALRAEARVTELEGGRP